MKGVSSLSCQSSPLPLQSRPFGVSLLIGGWDAHGGPVLFETDPSGTFSQHSAKAIGSSSEGAQTALEEGYR